MKIAMTNLSDLLSSDPEGKERQIFYKADKKGYQVSYNSKSINRCIWSYFVSFSFCYFYFQRTIRTSKWIFRKVNRRLEKLFASIAELDSGCFEQWILTTKHSINFLLAAKLIHATLSHQCKRFRQWTCNQI